MKDLLDIRKDIDKIDEQIVKLYEERMKLTSDVAEYKINTGKQIFDKEREESKLAFPDRRSRIHGELGGIAGQAVDRSRCEGTDLVRLHQERQHPFARRIHRAFDGRV